MQPIAIYHLSIKIISRGKGKSAVAAAAYRAGEKITNEWDGMVHDYTRKGGVAHTEILRPENAPLEYANRATLWNAVEKIEKNKNAQLAREIELALPTELTAGQNISLVREYCNRHFVSAGMCADICVHDKKDGNPHAHVMLTMRPFEPDGSWASKSRKEYILDDNNERIVLKSGTYKTRKVDTVDWNDQSKAEQWRSGWADMVNQYLEQSDITERVDHRSYERQGIKIIPTVHLGVAAFQMEKRGIRTERGDINRAIEVSNQQLRQLRARIKKCKNWLYSLPLTDAPSLVDMTKGAAGGKNLDSQWKKVANLKTQAKLLMFLQENNITDVSTLADKVTKSHEQIYDVSNKIKATERRLDTLAQHLAQYDNYKQYKVVYEKYRQLEPKKREAFYNKNTDEIRLYETAKQYFDAIMNGRTKLPIKAWREEQVKLTTKKYDLFDEYYQLKDDIRNIENLRRGAENIMREQPKIQRPREVEL